MAVELTADEEQRVREVASQLPPGVGLVEIALIERLTTFERHMSGLLERLFADDQAGFNRLGALVYGTTADDEGVTLNVGAALDQTIRERDHARRAAARFEEAGDHYAAAVVRGLA